MVVAQAETRQFEHPHKSGYRWQPVVRVAGTTWYQTFDIYESWSVDSTRTPVLYRSRQRALRVAQREAKRRTTKPGKPRWRPI
jgi:hypothetical protein